MQWAGVVRLCAECILKDTQITVAIQKGNIDPDIGALPQWHMSNIVSGAVPNPRLLSRRQPLRCARKATAFLDLNHNDGAIFLNYQI